MMPFPFQECRETLFQGVMKSLAAKENYLRSMERTAIGTHPANGLAFLLFPWHQRCRLSLRSVFDPGDPLYDDVDAWRHNPGVWKDGFLVDSAENGGEALRSTATYIHKLYEQSEDDDGGPCMDAAHMIFLAGAEALLDERVATFLQSLGINAHVVGDVFPTATCFNYMVFDSDGSINANYCEIVLANRIAARMLADKLPQ